MGETTLQLHAGRPNRGVFPVTLTQDGKVLFAGRVDPHRPEDVERFVEAAMERYPGLSPEGLRQWLLQLAAEPRSEAAAIEGAGLYVATPDGYFLRKRTREGEFFVPLANFTAEIAAQEERDDGTESEMMLQIRATLGGRVVSFTLSASRFRAMTWPTERLGAEAIVYAGVTTADHVRAAIQLLSPMPVPRRTVYAHCGWREIEGGWAYLHAHGAIGANGAVPGVAVDLPPSLALLALPEPPTGKTLVAAVRASLGMLELAVDAIVIPVFCAIWRAVLGPCDFTLHLAGASGAFKSELAALAQSHFGAGLDARHLPGSWHSTDNALEAMLFTGKDALVVIDDFAPCGGAPEVAKWHMRADRLLRAQGNNAGRGRLRPDGTQRPAKPPRGLAFSTGEDVPKGHSIRARMLVVEVRKGDVDPVMLTRLQGDARDGLLAAALAGFVRHVAQGYGDVPLKLKEEVRTLRDQVAAAHLRTPEIAANLMAGFNRFLDFARSVGAVAEQEAQSLEQRAWEALRRTASWQSEHQAGNEPAARFLELLTAALASGRCHFAAPDGDTPLNPQAWGWRRQCVGDQEEWRPQGSRVGWVDEDRVYLEPEASFRAAQEMAGAGGDGVAITAATLRKRLNEKGLLLREGKREALTVRRVLEGRERNVLHLAPGALACGPPDIPAIPDGPAADPPPPSTPSATNNGQDVRNVRKGTDIPPGGGAVNTKAKEGVMDV